MIQTTDLTKRFETITAVDHISAEIREGQVFGLIGTNGAGKSTFLKLLSGILKPEEGQVLIDGEEIFENVTRKTDLFYISDDQHYFSNATPADMQNFYRILYPRFDGERFRKLLGGFGLDPGRKINTFSRGM